ncbi:MAG TPA: prolyl oligopeptidase family serine peptidase [Chloroflexota bacterium]|nr:prolyl oligopeptidase family serine peptidase [Chloroflexota bacterium]
MPHGYYGYPFNAMQQCLATNDVLVVYANPRGSSSYGRTFAEQVIRDWSGEDYLDLMAVVDAAVQQPFVDAARLGIWDYSYGGYMTARTIGQTDRFRAAVCGAPCFDLTSMYGTSDIGHVFGDLQWGCEVEFARYPGGSHLFMSVGFPEHRADVLGRVLTWFKEHLGDPA